MKKLAIYFENGHGVLLDPDKVIFDTLITPVSGDAELRDAALERGCAIINWDQVCYIKLKDVEEEC